MPLRWAMHGRCRPSGYGTDPNLAVNYQRRRAVAADAARRRSAGWRASCPDIIIPADARSPSASAVGVVDFIDEWVSAPYPAFQRDRGIVLGGFAWLDDEAARRFGKAFAELDAAAQHAHLR